MNKYQQATNIHAALKKLADFQNALREVGGPSEDGILFEKIIDLENEILQNFGVPIDPDYLEIIQFKNIPNKSDILFAIDCLKNSATMYLLANAKTDIQTLKDAIENGENAFKILPELKILTHEYTIFVYNRIFLKKIDTIENILQDLRFVNDNPEIIGLIGMLGEHYLAETPHYRTFDISIELNGEEMYIYPEDLINLLKEKGVKYLDHYALSLTNLLDDDIIDEIINASK